MKIRRHVWHKVNKWSNDSCMHCGLIYESDLGWSSADGVECIERELTNPSEFPSEMKHYIRFRGFHFDRTDLKLKRAYSEEEYTIDEMYAIVSKLDGELLTALRNSDWITLEEYEKRKKLLKELGYQVVYTTDSSNKEMVKKGLVKLSYWY